jgi:hypothetical protein
VAWLPFAVNLPVIYRSRQRKSEVITKPKAEDLTSDTFPDSTERAANVTASTKARFTLWIMRQIAKDERQEFRHEKNAMRRRGWPLRRLHTEVSLGQPLALVLSSKADNASLDSPEIFLEIFLKTSRETSQPENCQQ